jgi:hypothetical protein
MDDWHRTHKAELAAYQRAYRLRHPKLDRRHRAPVKYGITEEQYRAFEIAQQGECAICGRQESRRRLSIDHDHETGEVRGLLCNNCNSGIGKLGDSVAHLQAAIAYLGG